MKLTVLGSGMVVSGPERAATGFALESGATTIVVDLGFGCLKNMQKAGISPETVNTLFFTHFEHPDHVADLVSFIFVRKAMVDLAMSKPIQVNLFGGPGFRAFVEKMLALYPPFQRLPFRVVASEMQAFSKKKLSGFIVRTRPMKHEKSSIGFRFEAEGKAVVFAGDTESNESLVELARNVDLLVAECNYALEEPKWGHMNAKGLAALASKAGVKAVLVHHFRPKAEKAGLRVLISKSFKGRVIIAKDLLEAKL